METCKKKSIFLRANCTFSQNPSSALSHNACSLRPRLFNDHNIRDFWVVVYSMMSFMTLIIRDGCELSDVPVMIDMHNDLVCMADMKHWREETFIGVGMSLFNWEYVFRLLWKSGIFAMSKNPVYSFRAHKSVHFSVQKTTWSPWSR